MVHKSLLWESGLLVLPLYHGRGFFRRVMNKKDEKELLEAFKGLSYENRKHFLAYIQVARSAEENVRKAINESTAEQRKPA